MKFKSYLSCGTGVLALVLMATNVSLRTEDAASTKQTQKLAPGQMPYFDAVNDWLFRGVHHPLSTVYNFIAPKPVRNRIRGAGHPRGPGIAGAAVPDDPGTPSELSPSLRRFCNKVVKHAANPETRIMMRRYRARS